MSKISNTFSLIQYTQALIILAYKQYKIINEILYIVFFALNHQNPEYTYKTF